MPLKFFILVIIYYLIINIVAFIFYGVDKKKAKEGKWRITERTLLILAGVGGALGAWIGMFFFHHKTKKMPFPILVPFFLVIHIALIIFLTWSNNHLQIAQYDFDKTSGVAGTTRIVQVSDLHGTYLWWQRGYVAEQVANLKPDLIVLTGDLNDSRKPDRKTALDTAKRLVAIADTYYVSGNHEERMSEKKYDKWIRDLKEVGVHVLSDEYVLLGSGESWFALVGLRDKTLEEPENLPLKDLIEDAKKEAGEDLPTVVLSHEPQLLNEYAEAGADFVLTGHAHGGQIRLPGGIGLVAPDQGLFPKYTSGLHTKDHTNMIVSRGIGNSAAPLRIFNCPELVVVDL